MAQITAQIDGDFIIVFGNKENAKSLHIHREDLPQVATILCDLLVSKGIRCHVTEPPTTEHPTPQPLT